MKITLPLPPNLNRGGWGHWRTVHEAHKQWIACADLWSCRKDFPRPPATPIARATVTGVLVMPAGMDDDNAMRRASKWPLDWLKSRGYILDDKRKHMRWAALPEQRITRKGQHYVELTLTENR